MYITEEEAVTRIKKYCDSNAVDFCKDFGDFYVCSCQPNTPYDNTLFAVDKKTGEIKSYSPFADLDRWCTIMGA